MSKLDKEKEEAKKNIRSLLLSAPVGLTLQELRSDYEEFMGARLPTKQFGYNSDEDFLRDLSDVVRMSRGPKGDLVLTATADESTKHIAKMVSKQRVDTQKWAATATKKGRPKGGGWGRSTRQSPAPIVPIILRNKIQQFLEMLSGSVPLGHFEQAFYQKMGVRIEVERMGFRDLRSLLSDLPFVRLSSWQHGEVRVELVKSPKPLLPLKPHLANKTKALLQTAPVNRNCLLPDPIPQAQQQPILQRSESYSAPSSHPSSLTHRSQSCSSQSSRPAVSQQGRTRNTSSTSRLSNNSSHSTAYYGTPALPANSRRSTAYTATPALPVTSQPLTISQLSAAMHMCNDEQGQHFIHREQELSMLRERQAPPSVPQEQPLPVNQEMMEQMCDVSLDLQNKIKQILVMRPKGLWASRLPFDFKDKWKTELPYRDQGFSSVIEFISAMPHIVRVERPNPKGDWLLFHAAQPQENIQTENVDTTTKGMAQPRAPQYPGEQAGCAMKQVDKDEKLKESVRQVLQAHTDGVSLFHFKEIYQDMTGLKLEPAEYGMSDVHTLLISLTKDVLRIEYRGQNISHLFPLPSPGPCRFDYLLDSYKPHALEAQPGDIYVDEDEWVPEDAVGPGVCYTPVVLPRPDPKKADQSVELRVSFVISPSLFWVHRTGASYDLALDKLMDALEETYQHRGENYRMPESLMVYGQVCATLFPEDNNWHRGIITGRNHVGMLQIYYVDYGNTCFVPQSSVRFLRKRFLKLPAQAIQARLAHVQPVGGQWSVGAKEEMLRIVRAKPMVGLITNIKGRVLSLCLTDTSKSNEDIHLNDLLVYKGFAVFVEDIEEEEYAPTLTVDRQLATPTLAQQDTTPKQQRSVATVAPVRCTQQRFVRQIDLTSNIGFHLINLQGSLYVMSCEVSSLFWEDDILGSMLKQSGLSVSKLLVSRDQYPALFQELKSYGVPSLDPSTEVLSVYTFSCLPLILETFGNASPDISHLSAAILDVVHNFDPDGPYWKGQEEETASASQQSESSTDQDHDQDTEDVLTMDELQMALRSLQILRKRILKRMTVGVACTPSDIAELEEAESKMKQTQRLITALEQNAAADICLTPEGNVTSCGSSLPSAARSAPALAKSGFPSSSESSNVKTNVVAPMVVQAPAPSIPPPVPAAQGKVTPVFSPVSTSSMVHMAATNRQMEEIIRQQDEMLQSMLLMGWDPRLPPPCTSTPAGHHSSAGQPLGQCQVPAVGAGVLLQMPTPLSSAGVAAGSATTPPAGCSRPRCPPAMMPRMPFLLRAPLATSEIYPLSVPVVTDQLITTLHPDSSSRQQAIPGSSQQVVSDAALKHEQLLGSGLESQGYPPLRPELTGNRTSLTQGQLLPELLPLLQSLKANCVRAPHPGTQLVDNTDHLPQ